MPRKRLDSSFQNIAHAEVIQVGNALPDSAYPLQLVAKIYDIVWFGDLEWFIPSKLRDCSVPQEVELYHHLKVLQGSKAPRHCGHFVTFLPSQCNGTVNVILLELIPGRDLHHLAPADIAGMMCDLHRCGYRSHFGFELGHARLRC